MEPNCEEPVGDNNNQQLSTQDATPPKTTKGNGKVGKSNYSRDELLSLFEVMERIQPIGTEEWEQVLMEHSRNYPGRDIESIRRKYNTLHRKQVQTGNPNVPPEILAAKRVKRLIGDKADIGGGEDENFDLEAGFSSGSGSHCQDPPQRLGNGIPGTIETRTSSGTTTTDANPQAQARAVGRESSGTTVASSRVPRKSKDTHQEFMDMWRLQMMMEQEERRQERRENRKRQQEMTGYITAIVGGIARAFGVEPPAVSSGQKRRRQENEDASSDVECID
jgi:hypothetical protein